jgi:hypothetical protein
MDLSGSHLCILNEYTANKGLHFENHLYGCLTLLEKRLDVSACVLDCSFQHIGAEYGFLKDKRAVYTGSETYQSLWNPLLLAEGILDPSIVDSLEDLLFDFMRDVSSVYFTPALDSGELPEHLLKGIEALLAPVVKRRRLPKTKSKRPVTPVQKGKGLNKTRRKPIEVNLNEPSVT